MGCGASGTANAVSEPDSIDSPPPEEGRLTVVSGAATDIGGPSKKENQDVHLCHHSFMEEPSRHLFGVMDGHGGHGLGAAEFCKQTLPCVAEVCYDGKRDHENMARTLRRAFEETHARVANKKKSKCDACHSGTTATVALLDHKELVLGWVGDSQAMILTQHEDSEKLEELWISREHHFSQEDEKRRALQSGGWVDQSKAHGSPSGPLRVYFKGQGYPGLMVSRSLGDTDAHSIGVSADPECYCKTLGPEDRYIIICSDGVWDVVPKHVIIAIVEELAPDVSAAAKKIVSVSRQAWASTGRADNITAQVTMIRFPDPPKVAAEEGAKYQTD